MKYSFHPEAKEEFFEAINYFEECQIGNPFTSYFLNSASLYIFMIKTKKAGKFFMSSI